MSFIYSLGFINFKDLNSFKDQYDELMKLKVECKDPLVLLNTAFIKLNIPATIISLKELKGTEDDLKEVIRELEANFIKNYTTGTINWEKIIKEEEERKGGF